MQVVTLKEVKNNFKTLFDNVYLNNEEVIIHYKKNKNVVLISLDEFNALKETEYLLSNPYNAKHLFESIQELKDGKVVIKDIDEIDLD